MRKKKDNDEDIKKIMHNVLSMESQLNIPLQHNIIYMEEDVNKIIEDALHLDKMLEEEEETYNG
jgi:hypothetical protein